MAGFLTPIASSAASGVEGFAKKQFAGFQEDPLGWIEARFWKWGWILLAFGIVLSGVGFLLRTHGARAANDETSFFQQEAALFGNLQPILPNVRWLPGQSPQIVADNIAQVAGYVPNAILNLESDVVTVVKDLGSAIYLGLKNLPRLLWDDVQIVAGFTFGNGFDLVFPYLMIAGGIMIGISLALKFTRLELAPRIRARVAPIWQEKVQKPLDRAFGVIGQKPTPGSRTEEITPKSPESIALEARTSVRTPPEDTGGQAPASEQPPAAPPPEPTAPALPEPFPVAPGEPEEDPEQEKPVPAPTAETEVELGDELTAARDRMRAALRERDHAFEKKAEIAEEADIYSSIELQAEIERARAEGEMRRALEQLPSEA